MIHSRVPFGVCTEISWPGQQFGGTVTYSTVVGGDAVLEGALGDVEFSVSGSAMYIVEPGPDP